MHILGAIAEFERARIQERVRAGLARAKSAGRPAWSTTSRSIQNGSPRSLACLSVGRTAARYPSVHACQRRLAQKPDEIARLIGPETRATRVSIRLARNHLFSRSASQAHPFQDSLQLPRSSCQSGQLPSPFRVRDMIFERVAALVLDIRLPRSPPRLGGDDCDLGCQASGLTLPSVAPKECASIRVDPV